MRKHRIQVKRTLAVAAGMLALGAGTAFADPTPNPKPEPSALVQDKKDEKKGMPTTMKVGSTTWTLYGFVEASAAYTDSRMNSIRLPGVVLSESPGGGTLGHSKGQFAMWARTSRLGIKMEAEPVGVLLDATPSAVLEFDFLGGGVGVPGFAFSEAVTPLRVRKAYVRLQKPWGENGHMALQVGQDWEIISPLRPSINEETYMWGVGNSGGFRPHLRVEALYGVNEQVKVLGQLGLGVTGAQDLVDADVNGYLDGEASEYPNIQLRAAAELDMMGTKKPITVGLWTHRQWQETDVFIGGRKRFGGWAIGLDFDVNLLPLEDYDRLYVRGELYRGGNCSDIRGGTQGGLFPGRLGGGTGKGVTEWGYWLEGGFRINESLTVLAGFGASDPVNEGLPGGSVESNRSYWAGVQYDVSPVTIGFSISHWKTRYLLPGSPLHSDGTSNRFHLFVRYAF